MPARLGPIKSKLVRAESTIVSQLNIVELAKIMRVEFEEIRHNDGLVRGGGHNLYMTAVSRRVVFYVGESADASIYQTAGNIAICHHSWR
jgi:hypothetical protein